MAIATRSCPGCTTETLAFSARNRKEAERYADWKVDNGALCDACVARQRDAESLRAAQAADERGLPSLRGSDKQIAWAERIRAEMLARSDKLVLVIHRLRAGDEEGARGIYKELPEEWALRPFVFRHVATTEEKCSEAALVVCRLLEQQQDAGWWIDFRGATLETLLREFGREVKDALAGAPSRVELDEEVAIKPEQPVSLLTARIALEGDVVSVSFPEKSEALLDVIKPLGYSFDFDSRSHRKRIFPTMGRAEDRAAELMHKLLGAGFIVSCQRHGVREKALAASFEPIYPRWVDVQTRGRLSGHLHVIVRDGLDLTRDMEAVHGLKSHYRKGHWFVRPQHYAAMIDMAEIHGLRVTEGARKALEKARRADEAALMAQAIPDAPVATADQARAIDAVPTEIDPELRDD